MTTVGSSRPLDTLPILAGRSHPEFVAAVCTHLDHPPASVRQRTFSDGAIEVKIEENVRGRDVFIVQSGHERPNDHVMELLFLVDAARRASAQSVTAVLPYFRTARETRRTSRGSLFGRAWLPTRSKPLAYRAC